MDRYKYLLKNMGILTLGSFGTKILSFFLVPLYTNILTTDEYGSYDLITTSVSLLMPVLTIEICDAVLRFLITGRDGQEKKDIISAGFKYYIMGLGLFLLLVFLNYVFNVIQVIKAYSLQFVLIYIFYSLNQLMVNIARGLDNILDVSVAGVAGTITGIVSNVILLLVLRWGLNGYFTASILAAAVPVFYLAVRLKILSYIKIRKRNKKMLEKQMREYSLPLIANSIGWWINNASDRYIVTYLCGIGQNGIYSAAYKIPVILSMMQGIFNQAWLLSAVKEFKEDNKHHFFAQIYNAYNMLMVMVCLIINIYAKLISEILFAKDFFKAWQYAPFLNISVIFGASCGLLGGIFSAVKNSKLTGLSTCAGAAVNILLDILLAYQFGPIGAAFATMGSYIIVWAIRFYGVYKLIHLKINIYRDIAVYLMVLGQSAMIFLAEKKLVYYGISYLILSAVMILYKHELGKAVKYVIRQRKGMHAEEM